MSAPDEEWPSRVCCTEANGVSDTELRGEFELRQARIASILWRFAVSEPPSTEGIPYSTLIPGISRELVWAARPAPHTVPRANVRHQFDLLKKAAQAMREHLLSDPSLAVEFPLEARLAITQVTELEIDLSADGGRPRKDAAARVARLLAWHFEGLTGLLPTRVTSLKEGKAQPSTSPFTQLLAEVYAALGIVASLDNQARSAIEAMEKTPPVL